MKTKKAIHKRGPSTNEYKSMVEAISFQNKSLIQANHRFPELTLRGGFIQDHPGQGCFPVPGWQRGAGAIRWQYT